MRSSAQLWFKSIEIKVNYHYSPEIYPVFHPVDQAQPGSKAEVEISSIKLVANDFELIDFFIELEGPKLSLLQELGNEIIKQFHND